MTGGDLSVSTAAARRKLEERGTQEKEAVVSDSDHLFDSIRSLLFFRRASLSLSYPYRVFFFRPLRLSLSLLRVFVKSRSLSLFLIQYISSFLVFSF